MDWPIGQDVNRQSRALLSVLLLGVVALVSWRSCSTMPDRQNGGEIVISDAQTRGGVLRSSLRSEPRTFNRAVDANFPVYLYSILTGSKLVRVNRATGTVEPALAERRAQADRRRFTRQDRRSPDLAARTTADPSPVGTSERRPAGQDERG